MRKTEPLKKSNRGFDLELSEDYCIYDNVHLSIGVKDEAGNIMSISIPNAHIKAKTIGQLNVPLAQYANGEYYLSIVFALRDATYRLADGKWKLVQEGPGYA